MTWAGEDAVLRAFASSRRCTAEHLRSGGRRWAAFTGGDLGALQSARPGRRAGSQLEPLPPLAAALIPRLEHRGERDRLLLSEYDARLLGLFSSGDWSSAMGRLRAASTKRQSATLLDLSGDLHLAERLAAWARHAPGTLEQRPAKGAAHSFLDAVEYRLTTRGMALLENGLDEPTDAPSLLVGGFVAYAADMKWACRVDQRGWRFVRIRPARSTHRRSLVGRAFPGVGGQTEPTAALRPTPSP